tara:strand:- start:92 stop:610 length:519 start_codon:yes stop_codon:yes gene_type:complete
MLGALCGFSQDSISKINKGAKFLLNEVVLQDNSIKPINRIEYFQLKRRVLKVYPYVDTIKKIMLVVDEDLANLSNKRSSRRYSRKTQKKIIKNFSNEIKDLSRKEGVVLSKLVFREFNLTVYELIYDYRGSFQAFFWQSMSKLYEGNLKSNYDPYNNQEDMLIEYFIQENFE